MRPVRLKPHLDFSSRGSASPNFRLDILGEYIVSKPVVRGSSEQEVTSSVIENYRIVLTGK